MPSSVAFANGLLDTLSCPCTLARNVHERAASAVARVTSRVRRRGMVDRSIWTEYDVAGVRFVIQALDEDWDEDLDEDEDWDDDDDDDEWEDDDEDDEDDDDWEDDDEDDVVSGPRHAPRDWD
jgi:hypothetical protein